MKLLYAVLIISLSSCAKNSLDIVNEGKPMGAFEPKKDYVVDIPMGKTQVSGESSGIEILGYFTIGASETAEGVDVSSRSDNILGNALSLLPKSSSQKFKAAALRDACEKNNCDVLGYTMYNVNEKNFFLFKYYDVKVKGFPGRVDSLENINRLYSPNDSYWR